MINKIHALSLALSLITIHARSTHIEQCDDFLEHELKSILGTAFNPRYMSIDTPRVQDHFEMGGKKRTINSDAGAPFYVDPHYTNVVEDIPAWELDVDKMIYLYRESLVTDDDDDKPTLPPDHFDRNTTINSDEDESFVRVPRAGMAKDPSKLLWECEAKVRWIDLGANYYPRYLRTVDCVGEKCWYSHYKCLPKSFTVRILKKKSSCIVVKKGTTVLRSGSDVPNELKPLWVWEERAVNMCCHCAPGRHY